MGPPLAAQTISGTLDVCLGVRENNAALDAHFHLHAYVTQGDSDTPRGTLVEDYREAAGTNEWTTTSTGRALAAPVTVTNVTTQAGDRLVIEIGFAARNAIATSYTGYVRYGARDASQITLADLAALGTDTSTKAGWVEFSADILEDPTQEDIRVTQHGAELFSGEGDTDIRVTQEGIEVFSHVSPPTDVRVTQHGLEIVSGDQPADVLVTQHGIEIFSRNLVDPCAAPPDGEDIAAARQSTIGPLIIVTWDPGSGVRQAFSEIGVELPDDADYCGGRKRPLLLPLGEIRRALSGWRGDIEVGRGMVRLADPARAIRDTLSSDPGMYFPRGEVCTYLVSDAGRRAKVRPRLIGYGIVDDAPSFGSRLEVELPWRDALGGTIRARSLDEVQIPQRVYSSTDFGDLPTWVKGLGVGFPLGIVEKPTVMVAPTATVAAGGSLTLGKKYAICVAPIIGGVEAAPSAPAWVTIGPTALPYDSTIQVPRVGWARSYNPDDGTHTYPYYRWCKAVIEKGGKWSAAFGMGDIHQGMGAGLMCALDGDMGTADALTIFTFNAVNAVNNWFDPISHPIDSWQVAPWGSDPAQVDYMGPDVEIAMHRITPPFPTSWASPMPDGTADQDAFDYHAVPADGVEFLTSTGGQSIDVSWAAEATAGSYAVYLADSLESPSICRRVETAATALTISAESDGDAADLPPQIHMPAEYVGGWRAMPVGTAVVGGVSRVVLCVAGCAIDSIDHVYVQSGLDEDSDGATDPVVVDPAGWLVPDWPGWSALFSTPYQDIIGTDGGTRRYTLMYGPEASTALAQAILAGTAFVGVDCHGVEDVGTGSGECYTDIHDQAVWVYNHLIYQDYQSGTWSAPPTIPTDVHGLAGVCVVNGPSFKAAKAQRQAELPGGYTAAWGVGANGERTSATELIARMNRSGAFRTGQNRYWQTACVTLDTAADTSAWPEVIDTIGDTDKESGDPKIHIEDLKNLLPYRFGPWPDGTDWLAESRVRSTASVTNYRREYAAERLDLECLRSAPVAAHVMGQHLLYTQRAPVTVEPELDLRGEAFDLGDGLRYTQYRGLGATGYVQRPMVVIGRWVVPGPPRRVRLECLDVAPFLAG